MVTQFKHTHSMPLLMALYSLEEKQFAETVSIIERFIFRYKIIGNAHIGPANKLYLKYSKKVREEGKLSIKEFRNELRDLVDQKVSKDIFEAQLRELTYGSQRGGGNGNIRYLLLTLEDYRPWCEGGAAGIPECKEKTRVFDFRNTSLDHINPRSEQPKKQKAHFEKVKDTIGNLAVLEPDKNTKLGNKPFPEKRAVFNSSSIKLNREIGKEEEWSVECIEKRTNYLVEMALKVFVP